MAKAIAVADNSNDGLNKLKGLPARLRSFLGDVSNEMKKVSSPSTAEVRATTTIVIITVFLFAAYFAVVDFAVGHTIGALLDKLTKH